MATKIDMSIPPLHPSLSRCAQAHLDYIGNFQPLSPPDMHVFLACQPDAMKALSDIFRQFGDRLRATFPGISIVHPYFYQVAHGYSLMQGRAREVYSAWRSLHPDDLARFMSPRVNEQYADVARHGAAVANVPVISGSESGEKWHANYTLLVQVWRDQLGRLEFGGKDEDKVKELMAWLVDLGNYFATLANHVMGSGIYVIENKPLDTRIVEFYRQLARGYISLADQADSLNQTYNRANWGDVKRRVQPRPNEEWFDFANRRMTNATPV